MHVYNQWRICTWTNPGIKTRLIGASLSEPRLERAHDNVPRRGECLYIYLCICSAQTVDLDHPWIVSWIGRYPQFAQDNPWIAPRRAGGAQAHRREVRVQQKFCLDFVCL